MSIKHPTSEGQAHNREVAVQPTFPFERSGFFYLSTLMVGFDVTLASLYFYTAALHTDPDFCPPEVKTIYRFLNRV